jgi:hypothetical protein
VLFHLVGAEELGAQRELFLPLGRQHCAGKTLADAQQGLEECGRTGHQLRFSHVTEQALPRSADNVRNCCMVDLPVEELPALVPEDRESRPAFPGAARLRRLERPGGTRTGVHVPGTRESPFSQ